jgi:hypothetical protein
MKVKPKEVFVNLPVALLFNTEDEIPQLASGFNTFLHGKVRLKYETIGELNGQWVGLFYLQRNDESQQLRDEFVRLIEEQQMLMHDPPAYSESFLREPDDEDSR